MTLIEVIVNGIILGAFFSLMAVGLTLIFGVLGMINFTHGILFMLGAYCTWFLHTQHGVSYLLAVPLAAIAVGLFGSAIELGVLSRFRGRLVEGAVVSIALAALIQNLAIQVLPVNPESVSSPFTGALDVSGVVVPWHQVFLLVVACVLIAGLTVLVKFTRIGRAIRALQQDPYAARLQGVQVTFIAPLVFGIGAALAALAGGLIVPVEELLPGIGDAPLLAAFVVVILGGLGSVEGTLVAAMLIGVTQSAVTTYWTAPAAVAVSFAVAVAVLVVRPQGLFGR